MTTKTKASRTDRYVVVVDRERYLSGGLARLVSVRALARRFARRSDAEREAEALRASFGSKAVRIERD